MSVELEDKQFVEQLVATCGTSPEALMPLLHAIQEHYGYLPREALEQVVATTEITLPTVVSVASFFDGFETEPAGQHRICVCHGTACHVKGADLITDAFARHLELEEGQHTDADGLFTLSKVACLGCCTLAPAVRVGETTYGHVTADGVDAVLADYLARAGREEREGPACVLREDGELTEVRVGLGSCCVAGGSGEVYAEVERALHRARAQAIVKRVGCVGMCHQTPLVEVVEPRAEPKLYAKVTRGDVSAIVDRHFPRPGLFGRFRSFLSRRIDALLTDEAWPGVERHALDVREPRVADFLGRQQRLATEFSSEIDPVDLDEYLKRGGFAALRRCIDELSPEDMPSASETVVLRGRGGAGFPTGRKWRIVHDQESKRKVVVCNGDEGDPGAFMDRMILESTPYRVIEGMAIAAHATGAREGILYIRAEYALAVERVGEAIARLEERSLFATLGVELSIVIARGAGAFICGEETALIANLEGKRGTPRLRPPFPAVAGYQGVPTLVNNVETLSALPWIVRNGAEAFAALGTERSSGTKVFALAGRIARGGLIEVPMGITIREVVEEIGGGIQGGRAFKAVQIGGPSGGCVPASLADTPVDFDALLGVGAMMGSGGFVVLDESDCMVDVTRYFLQFTQSQSCGRCTPCRVGTLRMLELVDKIRAGTGQLEDLERLEELSRQVSATSLCGLGKTAPNPVLSTIEHFREEWLAHLEGRCPAGKCKELIEYSITDTCIGCTVCAQRCPVDAIPFTPYEQHRIDTELCTRCDVCKVACPVNAIEVIQACPGS